MNRAPTATWARWSVVALGLDAIVLVATGVYLTVRYRPPAPSRTALASAAVYVHVVSGVAAAVLLVVVIVLVAPRTGDGVARLGWAAGGVGALGALVYELVRGSALGWSQLALSAVTADADVKGVWLPRATVFVLLGDVQVGVSAYKERVWLHIVVIPLIAVFALIVLVLAARRRARASSIREPVSTTDAVWPPADTPLHSRSSP